MNTEKYTKHNAVIYCRVSTKEQVEEGNSLSSQERNCHEYAQKNGYEVVQVFIEQGESAKTADRTELQKLMRFCSDKKQNIKAVIIYKIDRLSRNTDDYSQLRILLKRYGVEIKSTSEYFENTPAGRFMENIIANVAQFDNDVRTERSVGGMKDAVREGRYVWLAPVGYLNQKIDGKATIVQSDKAWLVKKAFELMAERKYAIDIIRNALLAEGLTSRSGKSLSKSGFYTMLKNELYVGHIYKFGEKYKGKFEPIVSQELFIRVQQVMRNKKPTLIYKLENPDFPLRRFIIDTKKNKLTGAWSKGRNKHYAYYRFPSNNQYWSKEYLEGLFYSFMDEFAFDRNLLGKLKREMSRRFSDKSENRVMEIENLFLKKKQLKAKQSALLEKNMEGVISNTLLKEQLFRLDEEIWDIDKILIDKEEKKVNVEHILEFISEFLLKPSLIWRKASLSKKINLQWFQFPEGLVFDGKNFGTRKISHIFKLKQFFLADKSFKGDDSELNYEHENSANSPPFQSSESIVFHEVVKELQVLEEKMKNTDSDADTDFSIFSSPG